MKIQDPSPQRSVDTSKQPVRNDDKKEPSKSFSKLLGDKKEFALKKGIDSGIDPGEAALNAAMPFSPQQQPLDAPLKEVQSAHTVKLPDELQKVVDEITVSLPATGTQNVEIQLNSKVLEGLKIKISRAEGQVSIQFQTQSAAVQGMIEQNRQKLQQALADRNVRVAGVRINGPQASAAPPAGRR